jgi:hypothetical protein
MQISKLTLSFSNDESLRLRELIDRYFEYQKELKIGEGGGESVSYFALRLRELLPKKFVDLEAKPGVIKTPIFEGDQVKTPIFEGDQVVVYSRRLFSKPMNAKVTHTRWKDGIQEVLLDFEDKSEIVLQEYNHKWFFAAECRPV